MIVTEVTFNGTADEYTQFLAARARAEGRAGVSQGPSAITPAAVPAQSFENQHGQFIRGAIRYRSLSAKDRQILTTLNAVTPPGVLLSELVERVQLPKPIVQAALSQLGKRARHAPGYEDIAAGLKRAGVLFANEALAAFVLWTKDDSAGDYRYALHPAVRTVLDEELGAPMR
jgi:hypothetical protein